MAKFAIMRCKKLGNMGSVAKSLNHAFRERETLNADPTKTIDNEHMAASSTDEAMGKLRARLPEKRRKDAVVCVEYMMTASPEWWQTASKQQQTEFFDKSLKWLTDKYGAENVIVASVHRDETSPHMTAFVAPITKDGRLSAKDCIGNKTQMSNDQTTFAGAVSHLGLERGIEGSKAKHQTIKAFYAAIEKPTRDVTITKDDLKPRVVGKRFLTSTYENSDDVAERLTRAVRKTYEPAVIGAAGAQEMASKVKSAQDTALHLRERLRPFEEVLRPLNKPMREKAIATIKIIGEKLKLEQQELEKQRKELLRSQRGIRKPKSKGIER
ncbi:MobV family relaxase [Klebsiella aerogenes]|uniref:MobV family relaxase n=1 Tax=Klebsiella aerogenes TaxID=548 RepID=UPI002A8264DA|nr:MobV family relaxase [Klebsiella aerogenes]WPR87926.1 MobV family relaxase [Klebsiella aerogenes]